MARSEAILSPDTDIYVAMKQLLKRKLTGAPVVDEKTHAGRHADGTRLPQGIGGRCRRRSAERYGQRLHDQPGGIDRADGQRL